MFEKQREEWLKRSGRNPGSPFNDPIAMETSWYPMSRGGSSIRTHKLVAINSARIEFKATITGVFGCLIFIILGLVMIFDSTGYGGIFIGLIFFSPGAWFLYFVTTPVVFDLGKGVFWKGRKAPDQFLHKNQLKYFAKISDIHALQLISETVGNGNSTFKSYELNLVLKDSQRIFVVDHGSLRKIREDTSKLSKFLNKPVWDAV